MRVHERWARSELAMKFPGVCRDLAVLKGAQARRHVGSSVSCNFVARSCAAARRFRGVAVREEPGNWGLA